MGKDTRTRIMENTFRLIAENGYDGTGMNLIAKESGVSKGDLYHHFKSKEDLLIKVMEHHWEKMTLKEIYNVGSTTKSNFRKKLIANGRKYIKTLKQHPEIKKFTIAIMPVLARNKELIKQMQPAIESAYASTRGMIDHGVKLGVISPKTDRKLLIQEIFMIIDAIEFYSAFEMDMDLEKIWEDLIKKLI